LYTYTTTVKKTTTTSKNYGGGGGGPKGPLLRDSLLSNQNIYKEFLKKIVNFHYYTLFIKLLH